ncbi:hypothetical protein KAU11_10305 [Candidatus Babeliales bacterium]|nr:hypothetical protein [Candidatus Babeliales bacterium]
MLKKPQEKPVEEQDDAEKKSEETVTKWMNTLKNDAKPYRRPHDKRWLRFYYLYRAYRAVQDYSYITNLVPPIAFEIIETVKPRLAAAKMKTLIKPKTSEDIESDSLNKWDNLLNYFFAKMGLTDKKIEWIDSMLKYGNGLTQISWDTKKSEPVMTNLDNLLVYVDPNAGPRLENADYLIKVLYKKKAKLLKDEEARGENNMYNTTVLAGLENKKIEDDPRADRENITTLKMGQAGQQDTNGNTGSTQESQSDKSKSQQSMITLIEVHDFLNEKIITIGNETGLLREDDHPYKEIDGGRIFVDLPCVKVPHEYHAISMIEPVETTINELADSRNQAMDNILYNLDPIKKIRSGSNVKAADLKSKPGATWEMPNADDVVTERPPEISKQWLEKDEILRNEIQSTLALSEYVRGMPQSSSEPMGKVELLLMQTNIRFSQLVRQLEISMESMTNIMIKMTKAYVTEDKLVEILGDDIEFENFTEEDRNKDIGLRIDIEPQVDLSPDARKREAIELKEAFAQEQPPETPEGMEDYRKRQRALDEMVLRAYDKEEFIDVILGEDVPVQIPEEPAEAPAGQTIEEVPQEPDMASIPLINPEEAVAAPGASTPQTAPTAGFLKGLLQRVKGRVG